MLKKVLAELVVWCSNHGAVAHGLAYCNTRKTKPVGPLLRLYSQGLFFLRERLGLPSFVPSPMYSLAQVFMAIYNRRLTRRT